MITALRGMHDLLDERALLYKNIIAVCEQIASKYGYNYIQTPKLERTALYKRSVGESSDIVGKEMYEFSDKGGDSVCLRPEGTAGVVRAFLENKLDKAGGIYRWYYHGSMFRYERPQRGRQREFHQFGVECFGIASVYEDAMLICMANDILKALNIKATLKINSLGDENSMQNYKDALLKYAKRVNARLCLDCKRRISTNVMRILDCKNENCKEALSGAPVLLDALNDECKNDFETLQALLKQSKINFTIDSNLVRGLDYYCKTAFEFVSDEIGAQSALIGGGRYDGLISALEGRQTPAIGWAMGVERIMEILSLKNDEKAQKNGIYLCALDENLLKNVCFLAQQLRDFGFKVVLSYDIKSPAKQLANADKINTKFFLCLGENEIKNNEIWLRNLENKNDMKVAINSLISELNKE